MKKMVGAAAAAVLVILVIGVGFAVGRLTGSDPVDDNAVGSRGSSPVTVSSGRATDDDDANGDPLGVVPTDPADVTGRNVVLINTDDLPASLWEHLPRTRELLGVSGIEFTNHIIGTSTCCPSRASLLSGMETHNHGVIGNVVPFGSALRFDETRSFVTTLHDAGYTTALYGKYLNGFRPIAEDVPPGWDEFHALLFNESPARGYYDYSIAENGEIVTYGDDPSEYSTTLLADRTVAFIDANAGERPFFVYYAPFAPHTPATAEPRFEGTLDGLRLADPPNFNEADVSDKPRWVRESDPLGPELVAEIAEQRLDMAESLASVDAAVVDIVESLERNGVFDETLVIFASDNGLLLGAHRQQAKECAYEECIRTPLLIHNPSATVVGESSALVSPADYAPTILEWTGVNPGWRMDGHSMLGAFTDTDWSARQAKLIQVHDRSFNQNRNFIGLRTETHTYVEYRNGDRELYDLTNDPYQLDNLIDSPEHGDVIAELADLLEATHSSTDLALSFGAEDPDVARGDEIVLEFEVKNNGTRMANHVYVVYRTPDALRSIDCGGSAEARCYDLGDRQEVRFKAIDPGATVAGRIVMKVRESAFAEAVPFEAVLEPFNTIDPDPANDTARFEIVIR